MVETRQQSLFIDRSWTGLPDLIIIQIFSYLDDKDRFRASLVCWRWARLFKSPSLWRKRNFSCFLRPRATKSVIGFTRYLGHYLQHLTFSACHKFLLSKNKKYLKTVRIFFKKLLKSGVRLKIFQLTEVYGDR